jgi:ABC-2 type transport system permease protein
MRSLWLMARYEYIRLARRRSFILSTFGFPLLLAVAMAFGFLMAQSGEQATLGYVDLAGIIDPTVQPAEEIETPILAFASEDAAQAALNSGEISAFYVIPADYGESHQTSLYYNDETPGGSAQRDFARLMRANLVTDLPPAVQQRLLEGVELTVRSADGSRSLGANNIFGFLLPFLAAILFMIAVMTSAGYLLQVVAEEKENRTMEILVTTIRPIELIGGKALGLMALALTQIAIWMAAIVAGLVVGSQFWPILRELSVPWPLLGIAALFFLPSYALVAGLMTAIGSAVTEVRQGQQIAGIINLLFVAPMFVLPVFMNTPNSPLAVGMTLFPTTSFVTVTLRWALASIPMWQLATSWGILVLSALLSLWASAQVFRVGMLRYGQPLTPRAFLATLQGR